MPNEPRFHPVYKSINKPLTIWGVERRLFFLALIMGGATFNLFGSLLSGILMFAALCIFGLWATGADPQILRILLNSSRFKVQYDPRQTRTVRAKGRPEAFMIHVKQIAREFLEAGAMSSLIGLFGFIDEHTFLTKGGDLGIVIRVAGVDAECLDHAERDQIARRFESATRIRLSLGQRRLVHVVADEHDCDIRSFYRASGTHLWLLHYRDRRSRQYGSPQDRRGSHTTTISTVPTGTPTTTTITPASAIFSPSAQAITLSATVTSNSGLVNGGTVSFTLFGTSTSANVINSSASVSVTIASGTTAGNYPLQAVYNPATGFTGSSDTKQLTILKATPVITWATPANIVSGTALGSQQLNATANVAGTFTYTPAGGTVLPVGNGQTLSVLFTPSDAVDYNTQTATVSINVTPAASTVLTVAPVNATFSTSNQTVTLSATLTSSLGLPNGGTVTFTIPGLGAPVVAAMSNGSATTVLTIPGNTPANTYPVQASYSGAGQFQAASDNTKVLTIVKATPTITWANPADIVAGTALSSTQLNATASIPGTFTYSPPAGTVLPVGDAQKLSALFSPVDTVNYITATASVLINVKAAPPPSAPQIVVTRTLTRDAQNQVVVNVTLTNTGGATAQTTLITVAKIGPTDASFRPNDPVNIAAGASVSITAIFPASVGAPGANTSLTLGGTYVGGSFSFTSRITLP